MDSPSAINEHPTTCESPYTNNSVSPVSSINEPLTTLTNFSSTVVPEYPNNMNYNTTEQAIVSDVEYSYAQTSECYQPYSRANAMDTGLLSTWPVQNHPANAMNVTMQGMPIDVNMMPTTSAFMTSRPAFLDIAPQQQQYHHHYHNHHQPHQHQPSSKPKRRRIITTSQRKAANIRERRRMYNINEAFDILRKRVPTFAYERRLSRIETLRLAIVYIGFMMDMLNGKDVNDIKLRQKLFFDHSSLVEDDDVTYDMSPLANQDIDSVMSC